MWGLGSNRYKFQTCAFPSGLLVRILGFLYHGPGLIPGKNKPTALDKDAKVPYIKWHSTVNTSNPLYLGM